MLISSLVWSAVVLLDAGLRGRRAGLMAAGELVRDIQAWEEAQKRLLSAPIHHPWALITQWWRTHRMEQERVLDDRRVCVAQQKQHCCPLWDTFLSRLIYGGEVCGEKMISYSRAFISQELQHLKMWRDHADLSFVLSVFSFSHISFFQSNPKQDMMSCSSEGPKSSLSQQDQSPMWKNGGGVWTSLSMVKGT